jgi:hypothetical protein
VINASNLRHAIQEGKIVPFDQVDLPEPVEFKKTVGVILSFWTGSTNPIHMIKPNAGIVGVRHLAGAML